MARKYSEEKVLKKLGIKDFREIRKEHVLQLANMADRMPAEVYKKALENFPDFSQTSLELVSEFKETLNSVIESNDASTQSFYKTCDKMIDALDVMLKDPDLNFESKQVVMEYMLRLSKMKSDKDTENKRFLLSIAGITGATVLSFGMILSSLLGGTSNLSTRSLKTPNDDDEVEDDDIYDPDDE